MSVTTVIDWNDTVLKMFTRIPLLDNQLLRSNHSTPKQFQEWIMHSRSQDKHKNILFLQ